MVSWTCKIIFVETKLEERVMSFFIEDRKFRRTREIVEMFDEDSQKIHYLLRYLVQIKFLKTRAIKSPHLKSKTKNRVNAYKFRDDWILNDQLIKIEV